MDVNNIALVRATNIIPFDGIVRPISEVPYLKKNTNTLFGFGMSDLLRKLKILPALTFRVTKEGIKQREQILSQYIPYTSDYNSMVLWSINGLVPDDSENGFGNNVFSNKKCVIIDGLAEQLELSDVVSLVPTDTAIKGNVRLSDSAIILIEQEEYNSLKKEEKEQLSKLNVRTFTGDLRQVVEKTLYETGRYVPERPVLGYERYKKSDTSEELKDTIKNVANERNILQMYHFDILMHRHKEKLGKLSNEYENFDIVNKYFQRQFYKFLCDKMKIKEELANNLKEAPDRDIFIKQLCQEIESIGIEEYKNIVDEYNKKLEELKKNGELLTPQQIVDLVRKDMIVEEEEFDNDFVGRD